MISIDVIRERDTKRMVVYSEVNTSYLGSNGGLYVDRENLKSVFGNIPERLQVDLNLPGAETR